MKSTVLEAWSSFTQLASSAAPGLAAKPRPIWNRLPTTKAEHQGKSGDVFETDKRFNADRAYFLIWAIPDTTVQKMIGAVNIVVSLMSVAKALTKSLVASDGHSQPNDDANQIAIST